MRPVTGGRVLCGTRASLAAPLEGSARGAIVAARSAARAPAPARAAARMAGAQEPPLPPCVPFLPADNAYEDPSAAAARRALGEALAARLRLAPAAFVARCGGEPALREALGTYLRYRARPYERGAGRALAGCVKGARKRI